MHIRVSRLSDLTSLRAAQIDSWDDVSASMRGLQGHEAYRSAPVGLRTRLRSRCEQASQLRMRERGACCPARCNVAPHSPAARALAACSCCLPALAGGLPGLLHLSSGGRIGSAT
ncbi:Hypothetical predicted protein [Marmota monax]|uniref:Uncharacterized protein n=1 Tax=Marmota monax TaxID=9995 RepID=A0A5E4BG58_MARMO|nr:Hypothetical predicted protein [Marmota monax]